MRAVLPAHLRRSAALLKFVNDEHGEAEVVWRGRSLGTWGGLGASHVLSAREITLRLRTEAGRLTLRVASARYTPLGAEVLVSGVSSLSDRSILLNWRGREEDRQTDPSEESPRDCLLSWVRQFLPSSRILSVRHRSDRANTLSGSYFRIHLRGPGVDSLILAARRNSSTGQGFESALSQALLWSIRLAKRGRRECALRFHLVVPAEYAPILQHRSSLLGSWRITVWQYESSGSGSLHVAQPPMPAAPRENRDFRWPVLGPFQWSAPLAQVLDLAPSHIKRYPRFREYDSLRLWGLEFASARGEGRDCVSFGIGPDKVELHDDNFELLRRLVDEILYFRRPDSPDPRHLYYRLQAERWLEALILEDIPRLFPELVPESVYPQIPVYLGKDPGRVDILGADREGTLVILELKVGPDPDLPMQALDYWGRVVRHNQDGDFLRRGYFSGMRLNRNPPKIYLVAPVFSFHDSTEKMIEFFEPEVEVWKISLNEDWRCGVRVFRRTKLRCGDKI